MHMGLNIMGLNGGLNIMGLNMTGAHYLATI
jgi:hypothetical protein